MKKKRNVMALAILLMIVGFAAVSTTLFINGSALIGGDQDEFDVYYENAYVNGVKNNDLITGPKVITFEQTFKTVGDTYVLDYDIKNGSRNYDAKVSINCVGGNEYISVNNNWVDNTVIDAQQTKSGKLTIEMVKGYTGEEVLTDNIVCEITANALERDSLAEGEVVLSYEEMLGTPITVTAVDSDGVNLNAYAYTIDGEKRDFLLDELHSSGLMPADVEVDALIEVKSDAFEDIAVTTFDVSSIADDGDLVIVLHFDETKQEWEMISGGIVRDGEVSGDFTSYSPVAFVVKKQDGSYETVLPPDYANLYNIMKNSASSKTVNFAISPSVSGDNGVFMTNNTDSGKTVYYYRGLVNNNMYYSGFCWKIIRTTESGGIRLIYNGYRGISGCTGDSDNYIDFGNYTSETVKDNANVGYMYGTLGATNYSAAHANTNSSSVKNVVDNWYANTLLTNTNYKGEITDDVYCNDREIIPYSGTDGNPSGMSLGYGNSVTEYKSVERLTSANPTPTLKCKQANDRFTVSTEKGNGALTYPVGLITADEAMMAGAIKYDGNTYHDNYLDANFRTYTMTPYSNTYSSRTDVWGINNGILDGVDINQDNSSTTTVRPVITLPGNVIVFSDGNGSVENPYHFAYIN